ncbi:acetyltransferase (GNAT) family protein [Brevibacterium sanguinis]|uniref:Acetyltransferase (GNAT) family protein n=3 Tax=Brevibacteriaceae TaxID=85019 RepID=A0A366INE8_9MICO|nr:acetyltransferase (GNAT) family protein [Brevibacterium sanguinis]RBP73504.1 acetyltransferase (GNAT) family protein [Brevibacterium celere]
MTGPPTRFEVWDSAAEDDREQWLAAWDRAGGGEPFSHPDYLDAVLADGESARCAHWASGGAEIIFAFVSRPIADAAGNPTGLTDIITPLVYGGPLGTIHRDGASRTFWDVMAAWARANSVVSEFIRFSPVDRLRAPDYPGTLRQQAPHVVRHLDGTDRDAILAEVGPKVRGKCRKAQRSGLTIHVDATGEMIEDFVDIYHETMRRVAASDRFFHGRDFFATVNTAFAGRFAYYYAMSGGRPVSGKLMLYADDVAYDFLSGTRTSELTTGAHVLTCVESMLGSLDRGVRDHVLTGGVTNSVEDSLLQFKRRLAPNGLSHYFTGERIFLPEIYAELSESRVADPGWFPRYRAPVPGVGASTGVQS